MRDLIFRVWDDYNKTFRYWGFIEDGFGLCFQSPSDCNLTMKQKLDKSEQYTGLLDKNGKKIFEGDIIKWDGSIIGAVSFKNCEFIIGKGVNARAMCAMPFAFSEEHLEIIGNIHENPELL